MTPAERKAYDRKRYLSKKERIKAAARAYYAANKEDMQEAQAAYRDKLRSKGPLEKRKQINKWRKVVVRSFMDGDWTTYSQSVMALETLIGKPHGEPVLESTLPREEQIARAELMRFVKYGKPAVEVDVENDQIAWTVRYPSDS